MRHRTMLAVFLAFISGAPVALAGVRVSDFLTVGGSVNASSSPISAASVVALNLSTFATTQTITDRGGVFTLPPLPAGVYRIIAFKQGFAPAIATVMPTRKIHTLALRLAEAGKLSAENREKIWEIRRSLPPDVLRELDETMAGPLPVDTGEQLQKFAGSMFSMTGFAPDTTSSTNIAEAGVALHAPIGRGWGVGFEGRTQSIESAASGMFATDPLATSTGVVLDLQGADTNFRFASSQSSWRFSPDADPANAVELRTHAIEWKGADSNVEVRYTAHQNLFSSVRASEVMEVAGDTKLFRGASSDLGVTLRVVQEAVPGVGFIADHRVADIVTSGRVSPTSALAFNYGLLTRVGADRVDWIPQSAAAVRFGRNTSIAISGLYKISDRNGSSWMMPVLTTISDSDPTHEPYRYRYAVAVTSGDPKRIRVEASASVAEVDSLLRVVLDDRFEQLWDGLDLSQGDVRKDVTVTVRKSIADRLLLGLSAMGGSAQNGLTAQLDRRYLAGDFQSFYTPSRTSFAVEYRYVGGTYPQQLDADTERINLRVGQSLWLPLDLRLLLGVDVSKSNVVAPDVVSPTTATQKRLVGGVSLAF